MACALPPTLKPPTPSSTSQRFQAWQLPMSLSGLQRVANSPLLRGNVNSNVLGSLAVHSVLTAWALWATVGAEYISEHLPNADVHQRCFYRGREEIPGRLVGKQAPLPRLFHESSPPRPLSAVLEILSHLPQLVAHWRRLRKNTDGNTPVCSRRKEPESNTFSLCSAWPFPWNLHLVIIQFAR